MRAAIRFIPAALVLVFVAATASIGGCGYAGEPKPPALRRPDKVTDLAAVERGSKIIVTFTLPRETTEGLPITEFPDVELRVGAPPNPWNQDEWVRLSDRVPVPQGPMPQKKTKAVRIPKNKLADKAASKDTAAEKAARRESKQTQAAQKSAEQAELLRSIDVDVSKYSGKTVMIGVLVHGPGGRNNGWSKMVSLDVAPVLPAPRDLKATDARNAVHLQWTGSAPGFSIFRREMPMPAASANEADEDWVQIGDSTQASFDDQTVEYGKTWQYYVKAVRQTGDSHQESDPSPTFTFTPKDVFPPAAPTGLAAISGARSIELVWDRVPDNDLAGYRVYRNGQKIADGLVTPAYSDTSVAAGARYSYQVTAVDQAGNESGKSTPYEATME
jgi:hypothetical protein